MKTGKRVLSLLLVAALLLSTSVAVFAETVLAIDIATLPTKLTYAEWEALDVTGGELTVYYSGSQEVIPITEDMVTGFDSTVLGTQTLTVSYAGAVCTYDVVITPKPASAIAVTTLPTKLTYLEGKDTLDVTGGKLTVSYADGTPDKIIPMTLDMVTGFDNTIVGTQTLTVSYAEQTTTFQVEIQAKTLTKLVFAQTPTKTKYLLGEIVLDITGGQIRLIYNNDTSEIVDMTADMVSGFDGNTAGVQTITVSYGGLTTTYQIEVFETEVISISVAKLPIITKYLLNTDNLDVTGGELTVKYYNDTTATIPMTAEMISGFDNTVLGKQPLTVTYAEKTTTFTVEISRNNTTEFFSGLGTVNRPYIIKTKEHLNNVRNYLDAHYMMIADIEFTEADFAEDGAFYNSGEGWQPIGTSSAPFSGCFDGNGHTIKGLQINMTGSSTTYAGLFGDVENCTIKNLGMVDSCIAVTSTYSSYVGGIAGAASNSAITNCYNTGSISASYYAGGIVGRAKSTTTITDCYNTGSVTAIATSTSGSSDGGGIVGYTSGSTIITDCYNTGNVTAISSSSSNRAYTHAGGIVGYTSGSTIITDCYNTGSVTAKTTSGNFDAYGGGIVGRAYEGTTITDCYNTGSISASDYAGGIVGRAYEGTTITDCYNTGSITAKTTSGSFYAGGIVGYAHSNTTITNCYNTGSVSASRAGGIVGETDSSTITNCYYLNIIAKGVGRGTDTATACTDEQMKQQATFAGFDFETVWGMDTTGEYPLPTLRSVAHVESVDDSVNFAGGNGSIANPYRIATKEHLNNVRNHPGCFKLVADIAFTEADFAEGGAFYNGGAGWQPIGTSSAPFNGYFDGNGHIIKGLQINIFGSSTVYAGLFGYVKNCTIKNLGMVDSCIEVTSTSGSCYGGGIVGYAYSSTTITDCYNTGSVTAKTTSGSSDANAYAGGIVGRGDSTTITDCYNTGSVTATATSTSGSSDAYAGGIAGYVSNSAITDCYNTGSVTAKTTSRFSYAYAGGIVGSASGSSTTTITDCYNTGSISASDYAGGIVGDAGSGTTTITDCYNTGSISSSNYAGGILGNAYGGTTNITNCYNTGSVSASFYAGGIVGNTSSSTINDCYNTGSVSASRAGGIVGYAGSGTTITNCYNMGSVTAASSSSYFCAGGIVGDAGSGTTITDCYYLNIIRKGVGSGTDTATACTAEQMKQQETFAGFDFDTVWTMEGHEDFLFPELQTVPMVFTDSVVDVSIETLPDKLTFEEGIPLDTSGGMLKVSYLGGKVIEVPLEVSMVTGFDYSVPGEQTLTVTYEGKTTTYTVTVTHSYETEWSQDETYHWHACSACGDKTDKTEHVYDNTCDTTCNVCGYTRTITHSFGNWAVTEEPTCTEKGEETRTCATCGKTETRELEALGHDYKDAVTDPTCTEQGYTTHTCAHCKDSYVDTYVDALGHDFGAWTETKAATCTEKGEERRDCSRCEYYETREVEALGHDYKATVTDPTCTEQGYTTHTCSRCDDSYVDTYVEALGHDFGEWTETKAATCTEKGEERRDCSRCEHYETREVEALGHDYKDAVTAPTCTEKGYTTHTCSRCDDSYVDTYVDALGHDLGEWAETKAATCTEKGAERRDCSRCEYYETREVEALGHDYKATVTDPTCTEQGYTTHTCSRCDDSYVDTYVDALGHDLGEWAESKAPTCTEKGEGRRDCSRCEHYETREVEALGHDYKATVTDPTCTEQGYTTHTCTRCGDSYVDTYVDALGHAWDDGVITKQPTATENGVKTFTCTRCGATRTEPIPATGDEPCDGGEDCPSGKFVDVNTKAWYHLYVDYAVKNGLFGGTSENTFEPETAMTRAMLVTVLWRYEGKPMGYQNTFVDVNAKSGSWYIDAVAWAAANNIVGGIGNGKFDPESKITREQMATILFRYANWKGIDTNKRGDLSVFPDADKVSSYATAAMQWAVAEGLINGSDGKLLPQGNATRAQVATILVRFIENIV